MKVVHEEGSRPIKAWVGEVSDIEASALVQLKNLSRLPFIHNNGVAVMPDVHAGKGSTVGSVIATEKAVIPAAVGVDIGCGMNAIRLNIKGSQLPDNLGPLRAAIEKAIPMGAGGSRNVANRSVLGHLSYVLNHGSGYKPWLYDIADPNKLMEKAASQVGTLGSGNHFIELCIDENDDVWIMLHSGSRGIGNMIGTNFIEKAKKDMERFFINLPDGDLAYLPEDTDNFNDYVEAVHWAQEYALLNRRTMMAEVIGALKSVMPIPFEVTDEAVNCHHNYIEKENHFGRNLWVTRKGAVRAREGELGIIPGSMGQRSFIVRGKGNLESYCSCSHGAGRVMSRSAARRRFSLTDLINQTEGVECRKDEDVIDEIPGAYKPIDQVMDNQRDLVEIVHTLKAVLCVKGG